MLGRRDYGDKLQQSYALVEKPATLVGEMPEGVLEDDERYERLTRPVVELEEELNGRIASLDRDDFVELLDDAV